MSRGVKVKDHGWKRIRAQVKALDKRSVTVGLHEKDAGEREPNAVMRGYYNEFGTENIPARPFIRGTHDEKKREWATKITRRFRSLMYGHIDAEQFLRMVGRMSRDDIKAAVIAWSTPPNAPRTVAQKGFDDPLIETGEMRDAVRYNVK